MARMMAKSLTSFRTCRWRGLGLGWLGQGAAPGTHLGRSTHSHPHATGMGGHATGVAERCSLLQGNSGCS